MDTNNRKQEAMQDTNREFERIQTAIHEHDLQMINWRYRFLAHENEYQQFCALRDIHSERIAFWSQVLTKLRREHEELVQKSRSHGWVIDDLESYRDLPIIY
jgi:hypothetical protein